jgi:t-SNARE complex subunit (syntaxin)
MEKMEKIVEIKKEQDIILGDIETGVDKLHEHAVYIKDELELQSKIIDDLHTKTLKVDVKLNTANKDIKYIINKQKPLWGCYALCFTLIAVVAIVLYTMITKK